ncbi:HNH endonuclease [Streptomyces sp. NPDC051776]|uniref:HNH endonuclease signature motif containing protein n=1 Tax=Streptomyces sp. NPDC051776 TaxID=3155414 RepID=UPI0034213DF3
MATSPYTKERLAEAVASSRTMSEALRKLGVDPQSPTRSYVRERMRKLGVDTTHFEREGARWTREVLEEAVAASTNMCDVLRFLGLDVVGGQHTHISRRIRSLDIDTSHFTATRGKDRSPDGRRQRAKAGIFVVLRAPDARRIPGTRLKQALIERGVAHRCAGCGCEPVWRGRPLPLEVDHIDGNWRNNLQDNLRLLCPNCHSATDTYRGRQSKWRSRPTGAPR